MKRYILFTTFTFCLTTLSTFCFAQQGKIGYADFDYIMGMMPEVRQAQADLEAANSQLQIQLQSKMTEYQQKLSAYQQEAAAMLDAIRQDKEAELRSLQDRIQTFEQEANQSLQKKQMELMKPIYERIVNAIEAVAKGNNFELILNKKQSGVDLVLYGSDRLDTSEMVLRQLGISP